MQILNNSKLLIYGDVNCTHAVNYQHMYNAPITLNYGNKHERTKYILPSGTNDNIELLQDGVFIYVVSQNNGLNYISLFLINTETKEIEGNVFLTGDDIDCEGNYSFDILNKDTEAQIKIMMQYL